jgi:hypothetical protein
MARSTLAGLEAALRLVDDVEAPAAPHEPVVTVATAQGLQGIANLHRSTYVENWPPARGPCRRPSAQGAQFLEKGARKVEYTLAGYSKIGKLIK